MSSILWQKQTFQNSSFCWKAYIFSLAKNSVSAGFTFLIVERMSSKQSTQNNTLLFVVSSKHDVSWKIRLVQLETQSNQLHKRFTSRKLVYFCVHTSHRILKRHILRNWCLTNSIIFTSSSRIVFLLNSEKFGYLFIFKKFFYWSIVDLQCCAVQQSNSVLYICTFFFNSFPLWFIPGDCI